MENYSEDTDLTGFLKNMENLGDLDKKSDWMI